jgi:HK97 family phage prohead protease
VARWAYHVVLKDIPRLTAITVVAPRERRNALAIFLTPFLSRAIDFSNRRSSLVQRRGTIFLAILAPSVGAALSIAHQINLSTAAHFAARPAKAARLYFFNKGNYTMEYFYAPFEIKASADSTRTFSGYGAVTGNIDSCGDIIAKGAFKDTVAKAMSGVTPWPAMLSQHGGVTAEDQTPIGVWVSMEEDDRGLKVTGKLANTARGRDIYELLKMKPRSAMDGLSIGYQCTDSEIHPKGSAARRTIKAVNLIEVSLVVFPANTRARVTGVKSYSEPEPVVVDWKEVARADYEMLRKEISKNNRSGW